MEVSGESSVSPATVTDNSTLRRSGGLGGGNQISTELATLTGAADEGSSNCLCPSSGSSDKGEAGTLPQEHTSTSVGATRQDAATTSDNILSSSGPAVSHAEPAAATVKQP